MKPPDTRPTSQKIAHQTVAGCGIVVAIIIGLVIACVFMAASGVIGPSSEDIGVQVNRQRAANRQTPSSSPTMPPAAR